jgi:hypothetical protein
MRFEQPDPQGLASEQCLSDDFHDLIPKFSALTSAASRIAWGIRAQRRDSQRKLML